MLDVKIWSVESPVNACYRYLSGLSLGVEVAREEEPAGWDGSTPLVLVMDGGGNRQTFSLRYGRVTVDVRHPDPGGAYDLAEKIHGLFCQWVFTDAPVVFDPHTVDAPQYNPSASPRVPAYTFTATVAVKSDNTISAIAPNMEVNHGS